MFIIKNHMRISFVPFLSMGIMTIILFAIGLIPASYLLITAMMWILISGLGISAGYHRVFSHRTHSLPTWAENIILFFATFAGQGGPIFWVALHRGYHHPHADTKKDLHSPIAFSKYVAFMGWFSASAKNTVHPKYAVDLLRKPNFLWFQKYHYKILWVVPLLVSIIDWKIALAAFFLPCALGSLQDNLVNVFGHIKGWIGYRNFETNDNSQNNALLGYFAWGQGWHNNHHYNPKSYDFGKGVSGNRWEWDPSTIFLPILNFLNKNK